MGGRRGGARRGEVKHLSVMFLAVLDVFLTCGGWTGVFKPVGEGVVDQSELRGMDPCMGVILSAFIISPPHDAMAMIAGRPNCYILGQDRCHQDLPPGGGSLLTVY